MGSRAAPMLAVICVLAHGAFAAGPDQYEPAALLVFPTVVSEVRPGSGELAQNYLSVTNISDVARQLRVSFISGESGDECAECSFTLPLAARGSQTLFIGARLGGSLVGTIEGQVVAICPGANGFVVAFIESDPGTVVFDNVLIGRHVIVDGPGGRTFANPAIPYRTVHGGTGDRVLAFDGEELVTQPRMVAVDFHAPNGPEPASEFDAVLSLYTTSFVAGTPPRTRCDVIGQDRSGNQFFTTFEFGCWTQVELGSLSPEFNHPNLGQLPTHDEHGWLQLNCRVDRENDGTFEALGGVHGALYEHAPAGTTLRRNGGGPALENPAAWGQSLVQSVTAGAPTTLELAAPAVPP